MRVLAAENKAIGNRKVKNAILEQPLVGNPVGATSLLGRIVVVQASSIRILRREIGIKEAARRLARSVVEERIRLSHAPCISQRMVQFVPASILSQFAIV